MHSAKWKADRAPEKELIIQYFHGAAFALKKQKQNGTPKSGYKENL